ncbi:4'-phosphopantetheinyl transferase [Orenia metallireducens]|jgi:4'-phosphopantetheinyl transferase|uniref:4'-phosphopantetheinyl transferase n=1 Tax=Orenia metallireducens TaxID=1413210 RepID=A0A285HH07_9FIRM|nr:4'-phosphopantetheinyl transferase superfamily protein [Orenia metallireducens]PRX27150.1 4'-phosphopantetheinyl transferase [Orenia metallireducens]SNY34957.1 4'-phosphopantetheinyl transferase [Orenia metallireducens]
MLEIFSVKLEACIDDLKFKKMISLVSLEKQKSIKKYLKKEDAYRTVLGELLIRKVISHRLKIDNQEIEFENNKYGKPFLKKYSNFYFNISHSGEWIVCAVDNKSIGIDIERIEPIDLEIAKKFFSKKEYIDLISQKKENKLSCFYDLWTLKESYIKAVGKGLFLPLDSFIVRRIDNQNISLKVSNNLGRYFFRMYDIDTEYKLAVCACSNYFPDKIIRKELLDLI